MTLRLSVRKGRTARQFPRQIDKYRWVNYGSSYLPSDMNAAYLWAQLECIDAITAKRLALWRQYDELLQPLQERGFWRFHMFQRAVCTMGICIISRQRIWRNAPV